MILKEDILLGLAAGFFFFILRDGLDLGLFLVLGFDLGFAGGWAAATILARLAVFLANTLADFGSGEKVSDL